MTRRVLPESEYAKLAGTPLELLTPYLPEGSKVVVIENDDGAVIGSWSVFPMWHLEGFWVADEHRQRGGVARALLMQMRTVLEELKASRVTTAAENDAMCDWLTRLGAEALPGTHFTWPIAES